MPARTPDGTVWDPIGHQMLFQCKVPHLAPMPDGYTGMWVNLALTVGNSGGTLFCPRAGSSGTPSTRCR
ncbi:hypothetical protein MN608_05745 [Microdochium nivale]|nr:hypothetical protein MN608_05745 [Microdochium nivale]